MKKMSMSKKEAMLLGVACEFFDERQTDYEAEAFTAEQEFIIITIKRKGVDGEVHQ